MIATAAALVLAASPAPAAAMAASCPREPLRVIEESNFGLAENEHPTHDRVRFLLDVGSDGRIRRIAKVESSGDPTIDAAAEKAVGEFRLAPPSAGCVSSSSVWSQWWNIPAEMVVSPAPSAPAVGPSPVPCAPPFVRPRGMPFPAHREPPGTAAIDVALDATARVTGVQLAQSSGNKKTDYAATVAARNGRYVFERQPGCSPVPTTYRLELTFR